MLELLRDPAWQFAGILLAAAAVVASFWIYWLQRQTKELAFGIVSSRRLLTVADEVSSRVRVELDGREIKDLHLTVYGLKNSGRRAVPASDFDRPLSLYFAPEQVISAQVSSQAPRNLGAKLLVTDSVVQLEPLLLNPGDHVLIQVLLSPGSPAGQLDGRVIDVADFQPINLRPELPKFHESGLVLLAAICPIIGLFGVFIYPKNLSWLLWIGIGIFTIVFGYAGRWLERARSSSRRRISEV
jgi:hypothetical protein